MKIIKSEAEYRLKDALETIRSEARPGWRGLVFRLSALKDSEKKEAEKIVFGLLTDCAADKEGGVYYCADGDIVTVIRGLDDEACRNLQTVLAAFLPAAGATLLKTCPIDQNDISIDIVCADKIKTLRAQPVAPRPSPATPMKIDSHASAVFAMAQAARQKRAKPCILLVEDDPASLFLTKRALGTDYEVISASSGHEAVRTYLHHAPDLVFLDIGLPDVSGHGVLEQISRIDASNAVVMLSANSFRDEIVRAMKLGAKGFVAKPFTRAKLLHYIGQCVPAATM